jgi:hypothetical protein
MLSFSPLAFFEAHKAVPTSWDGGLVHSPIISLAFSLAYFFDRANPVFSDNG